MIYGNKSEYPFFGKKTKNESDKMLSIYLRVTVNGQRFEISTQRYVEPSKWSAAAGKAKGNSEEARAVNSYLNALKKRVYDYQQMILQEGELLPKKRSVTNGTGSMNAVIHLSKCSKITINN